MDPRDINIFNLYKNNIINSNPLKIMISSITVDPTLTVPEAADLVFDAAIGFRRELIEKVKSEAKAGRRSYVRYFCDDNDLRIIKRMFDKPGYRVTASTSYSDSIKATVTISW